MAVKSVVELREEMLAVARGERKAPPAPPAPTLLSALTPDALKMLNVIATTPFTTVSGLAHRLGLAQSNVSRSLQRFAAFGLVREGREVRPELLTTEITMDLLKGTVQPSKKRGPPATHRRLNAPARKA